MLFPSTELILQKVTRNPLLLSTGIGYSTVKHLGEGIGNGDVVFLPCDLGSPGSAKKAAEDFLQLETRLDILGMLSSWCIFEQLETERHQPITQHR